MTGTASLLQIARTNAKCWVKTYSPTVLAEFVSGYKDLDGNTYSPPETPSRDDSIYPSGSSPWRAELYPSVASTNPSFLIALAPASISASVSEVPFGTLFEDATWKGIEFGNYRFKMKKGDSHEAAFEDISTPVPEPTPPSVPFNVVALAYDSNVNIYWEQTEATMHHWNVRRRTKLGTGLYTSWSVIAQPTLKVYDDGTVINDTTYQYTVSAVDDGGEESAPSPSTPDVTPTAYVPVPTPPPPLVPPPAMNNSRRAAGTSFSMTTLPCPDGTMHTADRVHNSWLYPGIAIAAAPVDYSTGSEIPSPTATDGEALTCTATAVDGAAISGSTTTEEGEEI